MLFISYMNTNRRIETLEKAHFLNECGTFKFIGSASIYLIQFSNFSCDKYFRPSRIYKRLMQVTYVPCSELNVLREIRLFLKAPLRCQWYASMYFCSVSLQMLMFELRNDG